MAESKNRNESGTTAPASSRARGGRWIVYLQLTAAMAFFGMSFVFTALALTELRPISIIVFRLVISLGALLLISLIPAVVRLVGRPRVPDPGDRRLFFLVALFQPFAYFLAENTGLLYASPAVAAIIIATIPVVTPIAAFAILRERLTGQAIAGALISFAGVALIVVVAGDAGGADPIGVVLIFGAVLAAVGYTLAVRSVPETYGSLTLVVCQNTIGLALFIPFWLAFDGSHLIRMDIPSAQVIGAVIFLGLFPSTLSFVFLARGIRVLGPSRSSLMANTVPIFAAVFGVLVLGETVRVFTIVGMAIVIGGVLLGQGRRRDSAAPNLVVSGPEQPAPRGQGEKREQGRQHDGVDDQALVQPEE